MSADVETTFAALPADVRLTILSALQDRIILSSNADMRDEAADTLTRLGYVGTAYASRQVRATLDSL